MFGIGVPELIVIFAIALIVLGPEQLPQVAKKIARFVNDLKRTADEFKSEFDVDDVTDLKLLDKMELPELDQAKHPPGGLGGDWKPAKRHAKEIEEKEKGESSIKEVVRNQESEQSGTEDSRAS